MVALPDSVGDDPAIVLSDIFPTGWFGAELAGVRDGDTVAVLGAGPVGQCAIAAALHHGAGRVISVDGVGDRLEFARGQHAETVDFNSEDPVAAVRELTGGIGVDRVIDAVGVEAQRPRSGPAAADGQQAESFDKERDQVAPEQNPAGDTWVAGDAPSQAARWAVELVAKAGTIGTIGVYPPQFESYPFGMAFNKNLTLRTGNCNHRRYLPKLVDLVANGTLDLTPIVTKWNETVDAVEAYERFDRRETGWSKVALDLT